MAKNPNDQSFKYLDLFAGCGGFSLGLESVGGNLLFALEKSPMAAETFMKNLVNPEISHGEWLDHLELPLVEQARAGLVVNDVTKVKLNFDIKEILKNEDLDLIVGGPPCQGFSLAGRRNHLDKRNSLAWDYLDYVELAKPRIVVIENVLGMNSKFANQENNTESAYSQVALALEQTIPGYVVQKLHLNSLHYGAAQSRERLFLVGLRSDLAHKLDVRATAQAWKSDFSDLLEESPELAPVPTTRSTDKLTVKKAIGDLMAHGRIDPYVKTLKDAAFWGLRETSELQNNNYRNHSETTKLKLEVYIALKNHGLSSQLLRDVQDEKGQRARMLDLEEARKTIQFPLFGSNKQVIAATFNEFVGLLDAFRTRKHSQRVLSLSSTPPTVITSPDDYIHPIYPRVLSVRELARFQGFSDHFVFYSKETTGGLKRRVEVPQYTQVGNAVSPFVSRAIGLLVLDLLKRVRL